MRTIVRAIAGIGLALSTVGWASPHAHALLSTRRFACQDAIAKGARTFVHGHLKLHHKCIDANLKAGGTATCPAVDAMKLAKVRAKLDAGLTKKCTFPLATPANLRVLGFPGRCDDPDPTDDFTLADLRHCIRSTHEAPLTGTCAGGTNASQACADVSDCPDAGPGTQCRSLLRTQYDPAVTGPLTSAGLACQKAVAHASTKFFFAYLEAVQRCRRDVRRCRIAADGTVTCAITGIQPADCATHEPATAAVIDKARAKAEALISKNCGPDAVGEIRPCQPDQPTGAAAATCVLDAHQAVAEELITIEFPEPPQCGDGLVNRPSEECDGASDAVCPGACGAPDGFFPCLCMNGSQQRQRIVVHGGDLDLGWTGTDHDSRLGAGGGYLVDLWDCDGPSGPDSECLVGPHCALPPHAPCSPSANAVGAAAHADAMCPSAGDFCRTTAGGASGPHCERDFKKRCRSTANDCNAIPGDRCLTTLHGAPLPLAAGGVAVCVVNRLTEDVVGTTNLGTGESTVRVRQRAEISPGGSSQQPCPVCGGFCSGPTGPEGPGVRSLCTHNADCSGGAICILDAVCSWGPNIDRPCRPNAPHGGPTELHGNPSVDCPPPVGNAFGPGLDLLFDPLTTSASSLAAAHDCTAPGSVRACIGGDHDQRPCATALDCPGGTCAGQCFCAGQARPNACDAACVGGAHDAAPCASDADCDPPNGFCHQADCRPDPSDTDSIQEGRCTVGPTVGTCSTTRFQSCAADAQCQQPLCPSCEPGESCIFRTQACFVNGTIERAGTPGTSDRTTAAVFCLGPTFGSVVDAVGGLPGPGAVTRHETTVTVGFPP